MSLAVALGRTLAATLAVSLAGTLTAPFVVNLTVILTRTFVGTLAVCRTVSLADLLGDSGPLGRQIGRLSQLSRD